MMESWASSAHRWIRCVVSLPGEQGSASPVLCTAKVSCADLIDSLELDRWVAQSFQELWGSSGLSGARYLEALTRALWYLERALDRASGGTWQRRVAANLVAHVLEQHAGQTEQELRHMAAALRSGENGAVEVVARACRAEYERGVASQTRHTSAAL